jgi:hypothetical protein
VILVLERGSYTLNFSSRVAEDYSTPLTMNERTNGIIGTIRKHVSWTWSYPHLPPAGKEILLSLFNCVWAESTVPFAWKEAVVVPILIPRKDLSLASSYKPISLSR